MRDLYNVAKPIDAGHVASLPAVAPIEHDLPEQNPEFRFPAPGSPDDIHEGRHITLSEASFRANGSSNQGQSSNCAQPSKLKMIGSSRSFFTDIVGNCESSSWLSIGKRSRTGWTRYPLSMVVIASTGAAAPPPQPGER
jgi:hypothetical protein